MYTQPWTSLCLFFLTQAAQTETTQDQHNGEPGGVTHRANENAQPQRQQRNGALLMTAHTNRPLHAAYAEGGEQVLILFSGRQKTAGQSN